MKHTFSSIATILLFGVLGCQNDLSRYPEKLKTALAGLPKLALMPKEKSSQKKLTGAIKKALGE